MQIGLAFRRGGGQGWMKIGLSPKFDVKAGSLGLRLLRSVPGTLRFQ
jgi:hypothetical protein